MRSRQLIVLSIGAVIALSVALTALDAMVDAGKPVLPGVATDFIDRLAMIGTMVAAAVIAVRIARLNERTDGLETAVGRASDEGRAWRAQSRRFLDGLSRAVEAQFEAWALTPAEADVAGLLLKGASLREIALLRRTAEATIRQQAQNIYRKSGLSNRSELSAYFLEDLFSYSETATALDAAGDKRMQFDA
jgi:DNA-binding NarL/FixJ family response regulator